MAMACGFLFMLGAGMIAAFLVGARVSRFATHGIAGHGPPQSARRERGSSGDATAPAAELSPAQCEVNRAAPLIEEEASSALTDASAGPGPTPAASYEAASGEPGTAPASSPALSRGFDHPAGASAASSPAPGGELALVQRAAEAALNVPVHRYGFEERKENAINNPFINARKHARANFRGSALATIYPHESRRNKGPIQCMVLTRDLSQSGIGIAHSEQLYPKQIIVLEAVGKLLVGEVRWCRRVDENFYVAGCRLVKTTG